MSVSGRNLYAIVGDATSVPCLEFTVAMARIFGASSAAAHTTFLFFGLVVLAQGALGQYGGYQEKVIHQVVVRDRCCSDHKQELLSTSTS